MGGKSSVFNMIGPVMIGPSSSHTAGVVRIGNAARKLFGEQPEKATITFYNSFARTYEGHGSDRAIVAGLLDFKTDDKRIKTALEIAETNNLKIRFKSVGNSSTMHPNTIAVKMESSNKKMSVIGESLGGGSIQIVDVDGFSARFSTALYTLIIRALDIKGSIAFMANVLSQAECNIATMTVSRKGKNDLACQVIEMDSDVNDVTLNYLTSLSFVKDIIYLPKMI
ncbi:MAG: L-serine ammonia-lyase, iron-sulfur-dependent subunit beta [Bacteroidota bacterium]